MKMKQEHYDILNNAIKSSRFYDDLMNYKQAGMSAKRWRWDCLWSVRESLKEWFSIVYQYLNDDHIDTALRRITNENYQGHIGN